MPARGQHPPEITPTAPLPIEGSVELEMPVERLWSTFADVRRWPEWNPCFWRSRVQGGELRVGARLVWAFNPIKPWYLYKMPAAAQLVAVEPCARVTWEVSFPGFHALHSYVFADLGPERSRFGSWEVAEGRLYQATSRFWIAHFRYVCRASLAGTASLARS